jgi:hypothetical protein
MEQLGRWLVAVGFREAMRLLLGIDEIQPELDRLSDADRCLLGMMYADRLGYDDLARILLEEETVIRQRCQEARQALWNVLH